MVPAMRIAVCSIRAAAIFHVLGFAVRSVEDDEHADESYSNIVTKTLVQSKDGLANGAFEESREAGASLLTNRWAPLNEEECQKAKEVTSGKDGPMFEMTLKNHLKSIGKNTKKISFGKYTRQIEADNGCTRAYSIEIGHLLSEEHCKEAMARTEGKDGMPFTFALKGYLKEIGVIKGIKGPPPSIEEQVKVGDCGTAETENNDTSDTPYADGILDKNFTLEPQFKIMRNTIKFNPDREVARGAVEGQLIQSGPKLERPKGPFSKAQLRCVVPLLFDEAEHCLTKEFLDNARFPQFKILQQIKNNYTDLGDARTAVEDTLTRKYKSQLVPGLLSQDELDCFVPLLFEDIDYCLPGVKLEKPKDPVAENLEWAKTTKQFMDKVMLDHLPVLPNTSWFTSEFIISEPAKSKRKHKNNRKKTSAKKVELILDANLHQTISIQIKKLPLTYTELFNEIRGGTTSLNADLMDLFASAVDTLQKESATKLEKIGILDKVTNASEPSDQFAKAFVEAVQEGQRSSPPYDLQDLISCVQQKPHWPRDFEAREASLAVLKNFYDLAEPLFCTANRAAGGFLNQILAQRVALADTANKIQLKEIDSMLSWFKQDASVVVENVTVIVPVMGLYNVVWRKSDAGKPEHSLWNRYKKTKYFKGYDEVFMSYLRNAVAAESSDEGVNEHPISKLLPLCHDLKIKYAHMKPCYRDAARAAITEIGEYRSEVRKCIHSFEDTTSKAPFVTLEQRADRILRLANGIESRILALMKYEVGSFLPSDQGKIDEFIQSLPKPGTQDDYERVHEKSKGNKAKPTLMDLLDDESFRTEILYFCKLLPARL